VTTITYLGTDATGRFASHPANVNGDTYAAPTDILAIIDCINGVDPDVNCPWGDYSSDVNRSDQANPADILVVIDLLNGAGQYPAYNGTPLPENTNCP